VIARVDASDRLNEVGGLMEMVSPRFFDTIRIPRIQGRDFTWQDDAHGAPVVIVNATLSHRLFPQGNAVGQRIRIGRDPVRQALEIVGVVGDAPVGNIREPDVPVAFRPIPQEPRFAGVPDINVRTSGNVKAVGERLRETVASLGRHYLRSLSTLEEQVDQALLQERLVAWLSSFFAGLAVLLACIGVYALLTYAVARRTREIGVRMALGASRPSVVRLIVGEGLTLALLGVVLGVPAAVAAGRLIGALLYGLGPTDAVTLTSATAMFIIVAAIAGLLPAYRASTIDPMAALRHD
jgi:predicted permease